MKVALLLLLAITLFSATMVQADDSSAINKLISEINAAAKTNRSRMLSIIIINTDVARETLEKEQARTGFSLGEIYVVHSIGLAAHKSFNQIAALKTKGTTWAKVAEMNNVSLRGAAASIKELMRSKSSE